MIKFNSKYTIQDFFNREIRLNLIFITPSLSIFIFFLLFAVQLQFEKNRINSLGKHLISTLRPYLQVGDEIQIHRFGFKFFQDSKILEKMVITTPESNTIVIGNNVSGLYVGKLGFMGLITSDVFKQVEVFDIFNHGKSEGKVEFYFRNTSRKIVILTTLFSTLFVTLILILRHLIFYKLSINKIQSPFNELLRHIENFRNKKEDKIFTLDLIEADQIIKAFMMQQDQIDKHNKNLIETEKVKAFSKVALQVAHDIRSPLTSLKSYLEEIGKLPEDHRILLRSSIIRIEDIANNLLRKNSISKKDADVSISASISNIVKEVASEKRCFLKKFSNITLVDEFDAGSYFLFSKVNIVEFKRVLSNLINNSIEAIKSKGLVKITMKSDDSMIILEISDDGVGIPESILKNIGQQGNSFGKKQGNGLGVFHAIKSIESWKGSLRFDSTVNIGTRVTISLPQSEPPIYFISELKIKSDSKILIIDDDENIHHVWERRFSCFKYEVKKLNIQLLHFYNSKDVLEWVEKNKEVSFYILCDYELIGDELNGIDLLKRVNLKHRSILVTSRYEEECVIKKCKENGLKLISKDLANQLKLSFSVSNIPCNITRFDAILLDDDKIVRNNWKRRANILKKNILCFENPADLLESIDYISKDTPFYIDSNLGEGIKGEMIAEDIYKRGWSNVYMATGYEVEEFGKYTFLKGVLSKEFPIGD